MKKLLPLLFILILLSACGPSEADIAEAIAETEAAKPTETFAPEPTATATFTPEPTATNTPEPSPTPDSRIIQEESRSFLCEKDDMPADGKYYLPGAGWISPHKNEEIISDWGREEGLAYIEETGRIEGWWVYYARGSSTNTLPEEMFCNIVRYETSAGAQLSASKYGYDDYSTDSDYQMLDLTENLGDNSFAFVYKEMQSNGKNQVWVSVVFVYRNYYLKVRGWGWEDDVQLEDLIIVAQNILAKLEEAPLISP